MTDSNLTDTDRVFADPQASATQGRVVWAPAKSLWFSAMATAGVMGVVVFPSWQAAGVTLALMILTLCLGHSVGMHRLLIHRAFETPRWLEYLLVYLGTLVGMAGPIGMFRIHEIRDWQQRQPDCHPFAKHNIGFWRDALWQMHCELHLARPPQLLIEPRVTEDRFYLWLERTWRWQQLPLALGLYAMGGIGFVLWGIGLRIAVSLAGHWVTVHFAHTRGARPFMQDEIAVDGRNLPALGLFTFGEAFHNNHHAYPSSARMGHDAQQIDPGWWVIRALAAFGLAWDVRVPAPDAPVGTLTTHASPAPQVADTALGRGNGTIAQLRSHDRVTVTASTSAADGRIVWAKGKSLWLFAHIVGGLAALIWFPSLGGALAFLALSAITLLAGHSVGMHRMLIHRSFTAPRWLEYLLVWLGTLVGMAGPMGMIRAHDMRDWHQRQTTCPPHPSHGAGWLKDAWWQLHCEYRLTHPPRFEIEPEVAEDPIYRWMERHWMAQQLIPAAVLFAMGGIGWVLWGISLRIAVSLIGHWAVGHAAHKGGHQGWSIEGLPVQGYNLSGLGLVTFGECFHGNHHAFPHSAQLGVERGQVDPGYWFIRALEGLGLAWDVKGPTSEPPRTGLTRTTDRVPSHASPHQDQGVGALVS